MFVCRGCIRSLTGTAANPIGPHLLAPLHRTTGALSVSSRRTYIRNGAKVGLRSATTNQNKPGTPRTAPKRRVALEEQGLAEDHEELEYENLKPQSDEAVKRKYEKKLEANVKKHLSLMPDPYHIAQHIENALGKGKFDEALLMTRMASRNTKVEVSWNHLIDYQLKNERLHAAIKLYNEMKKRAQIPNAKTYTIIFRGCAHSIHPKLAVSEATRIYNFMIKYGALKPNTIHMNAVLEVCARSHDLESLFTILATANGQVRSPDAHTYTIVLNALRHDVLKASGRNLGLVDEEVKREIEKNLQRARAIWVDVIANWRSGKMIIDEYIVSAMGRTLAAGEYQDNDSVLDLLEQTMQIPRFDKPNVSLPLTKAAAKDGPDTSDMSPKNRKAMTGSQESKTPLFAKPGNKTLSLILSVLSKTRKTASAAKYWAYFTQHLGVKPDSENHWAYLGALTTGHASAQVAAFIESMPKTDLSEITFRRGMSACISDNLNKDAFKHACRIFDVMTTTQRYPDPLSMRLFLHAARANTRHFHQNADARAGERAHGEQIAAALDRMWEPFRILSSSLSYPAPEVAAGTRSPEQELGKQRAAMSEIQQTARRMIAAIDRASTGTTMLSLRAAKLWRTRRIILQKAVERWVRKLYPDGEPQEPREKKAVLDDAKFVRGSRQHQPAPVQEASF